jgi:hypothetical protein
MWLGGVKMTRRERRERKAARLREWAEKRRQRAEAVFRQGEHYRGDVAFNTQPGHIPERARLIAREDRAYESLNKARSMEARAAGIEDQLDRSIYVDDEDALERLEERIVELEAERERKKAINRALRAAYKADPEGARFDVALADFHLDAKELADLKEAMRFAGSCGYPAYVFQNLTTNIARYWKRLEAARPPTEASGSPGTPRLETTTRPMLSALQRHLDALPDTYINEQVAALKEGAPSS